ncbi:zinc finger protein 510 [Bombina bombina]|uniref:zinc finger protein 510 n=1 Tax=Bombina bombina TaxID=8345 RepID=UPI00235B145E|nr:zinc finger protein 510 [Bombina bombina]
MNSSQRASVSFADVTASFTEEEWFLLEEWHKELYGNVMREIHNVLLDLGYRIENSDVLFRIMRDDEPVYRDPASPRSPMEGAGPNLMLRISSVGEEMPPGELEMPERCASSNTVLCTSNLLLKIKQEDDLYGAHTFDSKPVESSHCVSPALSDVEPTSGNEIKSELRLRHQCESDESANSLTSGDWSPTKLSQESKSPSSGEAPELPPRARRRKGIARQIKPMAALHDSDQNQQTDPKENEIPKLPHLNLLNQSDCNSFKFPFPHVQAGEDSYQYNSKDLTELGEDGPISFQQRGQTFIICSVCAKTFCNNSSFQVHMRTHTGERPYKCTDCDKSFIRSSHLKIHLRTHTGERPYKCSECEKSFRDNSSFARHQRIHTGEKPYQCATCGKYFRKKSNLKDHYRTHTGERPYKCKHCEKSFHQKSNLRVHERNHHGEDC